MSERLKFSPVRSSFEVSPKIKKATNFAGEIFFGVFSRGVKIEGRENLPKDINESRYLVAFNHMGWAEVLVLLKIFSPSWVHWLGKREIFDHKFLGRFVSSFGVIPIRRGEIDRQALQSMVDLLEEGKILGMAPEGTRGRGEEFGRLKKAKHGVVRTAWLARAPIIPVGVWGTERVLPLIEEKGLKLEDLTDLFERPEIFARIGKPFRQHLDESLVELDRETREKLTTNLMLEIRDMLPPEYHGYYAGVNPQSL